MGQGQGQINRQNHHKQILQFLEIRFSTEDAKLQRKGSNIKYFLEHTDREHVFHEL